MILQIVTILCKIDGNHSLPITIKHSPNSTKIKIISEALIGYFIYNKKYTDNPLGE
jgi:hypothetical protein